MSDEPVNEMKAGEGDGWMVALRLSIRGSRFSKN
jgi:hypothetical protein